ncbi:MAG TPA: hypothetical protein VJ499_07760 [Flavisolibacter sp.]|nr:hypothetical protein [Flavisolibacter sp.]
MRYTTGETRLKSLKQRHSLEQRSLVNNVKFRNIGPTIMSGRVDDIEANPDDPTEFYVAYASGGLWHTTNNGQSFTPIFDSAEVISIGDVAVNWKTRTIWVGTGEVNSSRSSYSGIGVYKSKDEGRTWEYLGLPESHHIGKIVLHPGDDNTAWVAVLGHLYSPNKERGVYKTTDGGKTWKQTLAIDENTGAVDMDINLQNPDELYATAWYRTRRAWNFEESGKSSGLYKSTDGGSTWQLISTPGSGLPSGANIGRMGVAVYPKDPQVVYVIVDNQQAKPDTAKKDSLVYAINELKDLSPEQFANLDDKKLDTLFKRNGLSEKYNAQMVKQMVASNQLKPTSLYDYFYVNTGFESNPVGAEVYRSDNGGKSWSKTNKAEIPIFFSYGYYFAKIYVSPYNPDKVYALGLTSQVSIDGGKTWKSMDKQNVHSDHHALWIDPKRDSHLINGNDGGVNITYDNGDHWFKANTPPVGQFYNITVDNAKPYNVYGGLQDNGVWYVPSTNYRNAFDGTGQGQLEDRAKNIGGGDGMQVQVDIRDNLTTYYGSQFGNYSRSNRLTREGTKNITPKHELGEKPLRFNWQAPILLSPHNNDIVYFGSNKFHRSFNQGDTMIALTGDLTKAARNGNVPYGTLTTISESPIRFGLIYTGSDDGNVYVTKDAGAHWELISAKPKKKSILPQDLWVSRITASRFKEGRVYLSFNGYRNDDFAPYLYVSNDYGATWTVLGKDLPTESINVVKEDPKNENIIYVGTDGGLYVSFDKGSTFMAWNAGLPKSIPIHDIAFQERENDIILGTHGRSLYVASLNKIHEAAPKR